MKGWFYLFYVHFKLQTTRENVGTMSQTDKQSEVNRLLGEKEHLKQEEAALRKVIEAVKKQVSALQVEQLEIKNRVPLSRVSPSFFLGQPSSRPAEEVEQGQEIGHFSFGSSIVLIFEAPLGLQLTRAPRDKVRLGEYLL